MTNDEKRRFSSNFEWLTGEMDFKWSETCKCFIHAETNVSVSADALQNALPKTFRNAVSNMVEKMRKKETVK